MLTGRRRPLAPRGLNARPDFVHSGGAYLGLCAGAYYACARVEFEPGSAMEVAGGRELSFFPGVARGAAVPGGRPHEAPDHAAMARSMAGLLRGAIKLGPAGVPSQTAPCYTMAVHRPLAQPLPPADVLPLMLCPGPWPPSLDRL
jgi:hypothetical protein